MARGQVGGAGSAFLIGASQTMLWNWRCTDKVGIPVLGIKGTPTLKDDVPTCLSKELARMGGSANITACSVPRSEGLRESMLPGYYTYPVNEAARMYPILIFFVV